MKRTLSLVVTSFALAIGFVACSQKPESGATTAEAPVAAPPTAAPTPPEPAPAVVPHPVEPAPGQAAAAALVPPCGDEDEGLPMCPLDHWMDENMLKATEDRDLPAMAKALHTIELLSPNEAWNQGEDGWAQLARKGATAAEAGNYAGAKATCKGCHKRWRDELRGNEAYRRRPFPQLPANAHEGLPTL